MGVCHRRKEEDLEEKCLKKRDWNAQGRFELEMHDMRRGQVNWCVWGSLGAGYCLLLPQTWQQGSNKPIWCYSDS